MDNKNFRLDLAELRPLKKLISLMPPLNTQQLGGRRYVGLAKISDDRIEYTNGFFIVNIPNPFPTSLVRTGVYNKVELRKMLVVPEGAQLTEFSDWPNTARLVEDFEAVPTSEYSINGVWLAKCLNVLCAGFEAEKPTSISVGRDTVKLTRGDSWALIAQFKDNK